MNKNNLVADEVENIKAIIEHTEDGNFTYILECSDGTLYTGWTNNLRKRIMTHNNGRGAKYTKTRLPVKLVYFEKLQTKEEAMSREWHIKKLSRTQKLILIKNKNLRKFEE